MADGSPYRRSAAVSLVTAAEPDKGYDAKAATYRAIAEQDKASPL